jgi:hypothetical protein
MAVGAFSHSREEPSMSVSTAPSNWQVLVPRRRSGPRSRIAVASRTHCDTSFRPFNRDAEVLPLTRDHDRVDARDRVRRRKRGRPGRGRRGQRVAPTG